MATVRVFRPFPSRCRTSRPGCRSGWPATVFSLAGCAIPREYAVGVASHAGGPVRVARACRCDRLFNRSEPASAGPFDRIFHLAIKAGNRSRERAINDPSETPELAHLIALIRRAMRDRQVLVPDMLNDVQVAALAAAWLDARSANPGNDPSC